MDKPLASKTPPHLNRFMEFIADLNKETERGAALVSASMIDELLGRTIEAFLLENGGSKFLLSGGNPPLGTLASKIAASFAMGLISETEHDECSTIRKIRNEFAHQLGVSFGTPAIAKLCDKLKLGAQNYGDVVIDKRGTFVTSATALILNLTNRPHYVGQRRLMYQDWPR